MRLELPTGRELQLGAESPHEPAVLRVHSLRALRRVATGGDIGLAEGYMSGDWDTPDLAYLLTALATNFEALNRLGLGGALHRLVHAPLKWLQANTPSGARRNIRAHYDLGNAFYAAWLDEGMTYSAGLFDRVDDLAAAQERKFAALAQAVRLAPGQRVLEIGCGWGGFAEYAARVYGAQVTAVTLSPAQHTFATERMARAGLSHLVDVRLCDYRQLEGQFDRIVSIEMFEAVGEAYWQRFFELLRGCLAPGGVVGMQVITIQDDLFADYRGRVDFIQRYIFPGGMLPSKARLLDSARAAGFQPSGLRAFGMDYARTLRAWLERFDEAWPGIAARGFGERFRRMWRFYLAYCEAGFASGRTDVIQVVFTHADPRGEAIPR